MIGRAPVATCGAILAALALSGCNKPPANTVDDAALDQIGAAVETALNEPPAAIVGLIKAANGPIALDSLAVTFDQRATPVDWWLLRRGYVMTAPSQPGGRPTFLLTDKGRQQRGVDAPWFTTAVGEPKTVDCQSPAALEALGCEVEVEVTPALTEAGKAVATQTSLAPINVHALVAPNDNGWEVRQLTTDGGALHDLALNIILGPQQARDEARKTTLADLTLRQEIAVGGDPIAAAAAAAEIYTPPVSTPPPDIAPLAPVQSNLPKRPGLR
jgi:hypothetical protein